jgi:signal transduction histidine kinase
MNLKKSNPYIKLDISSKSSSTLNSSNKKHAVPLTPSALLLHKKNTAFYTVSRNSSSKRLSLLIEESCNKQTSLQKTEEKLLLFNQHLSLINQSTCSVIGQEYFNNLVESLATVFGMRYAFIGKIEEGSPQTLRTVALWDRNKIVENLTFVLKGTPCEKVIDQEAGFFPQNVQNLFPQDQCLVDRGIHSYLGVPLINSEKKSFGVLSVMDEKPIEDHEHFHSVLNIFAARCSSEIERMNAEVQLKIRTQELEKSNRIMKEFVSIASHDLQEPLRKIVLFGSLLNEEDPSLKPKSKEYLQKIQKTTLRMQNLIESLLHFSEACSLNEPLQKINLNAVLKQLKPEFGLLSQETTEGIIDDPLPTILGNPTQIKQLLQNILSNAVKFKEDDQPPKITITCCLNQQSRWEVSIKDQGIGFDEIYKNRIFRPFEKLHGQNKYDGTGMGLAICQKIMENHCGTINVRSQLGQGAIFTMIFPYQKDI